MGEAFTSGAVQGWIIAMEQFYYNYNNDRNTHYEDKKGIKNAPDVA